MRITVCCGISDWIEPVYRLNPVRRVRKRNIPIAVDNSFSMNGKKTFTEFLIEAFEKEEGK